jgi:integrase
MIDNNPLIGIKITDFGDFIGRPKGSALKPYMTQALLDGLKDQKPVTQMIVLLMITLGTRIGETRQAKWKNLYFGEQAVWTIPASDTKTAEDHTISLPPEVAGLFQQWKKYQAEGDYSGPYLFPCLSGKALIGSSEASVLIKEFSAGEWSSHDLRKCARIAWAEQGTNFAVGEKMLSHKLGKIAEAYLDTKVTDLRLQALKTHVTWLLSLKKTCFLLV